MLAFFLKRIIHSHLELSLADPQFWKLQLGPFPLRHASTGCFTAEMQKNRRMRRWERCPSC